MSSVPARLAEPLFRRFAASRPLRTGSLIVSIFGDSITPRGGVVWLGSLIEALAPLGISHRLVRTAVYRLVQDQILSNEQQGRRSYYALTDAGRRQFEEATQRIYSERPDDWDGTWCIVLTSLLDSATTAAVRKDLGWLGFGRFGGDVLAHPNPDREQVARHLDALGCRQDCGLLTARLSADQADTTLPRMVANAWDLPRLESAYTEFIDRFRPLLLELRKVHDLSSSDAFYIRTFVIHEYRRVLLRDPCLPRELLPRTWKGHTAYQLTSDLYRLVLEASERFVDAHFENQIGALPAPDRSFYARFGGLRRGSEA